MGLVAGDHVVRVAPPVAALVQQLDDLQVLQVPDLVVMLLTEEDDIAVREILDEDGFFDTGDVSTVDRYGYMHITDRAKDLEPEQETCYAFWCKKKSCEKCVSSVSYLLDRPVFKLEQMKNRVYLVAATPLKAANTTVVVETIKEVTNAFFTETDLQEADRLSQEYFKALPARQSSGDIYDRNLVDRFLPVSIRRARMEEKPLSLIMTAVDYLDSVDCETQPGAREDVLNRYVAAISEEMKEENGWAGRFTGDIFIIVLHETDDKKAHAFAQNLKSRFQSETEGAEESGTRKLSPAFGIKTVEKAIVNPGAVVKKVLAALLKDRYDGSDRKEEYAITT